MNLKEYTFWQLFKLSKQIELEIFIRTWWIIPSIAFLLLSYYLYVNRK